MSARLAREGDKLRLFNGRGDKVRDFEPTEKVAALRELDRIRRIEADMGERNGSASQATERKKRVFQPRTPERALASEIIRAARAFQKAPSHEGIAAIAKLVQAVEVLVRP